MLFLRIVKSRRLAGPAYFKKDLYLKLAAKCKHWAYPNEVMYGTQLRLPLERWLPLQQCNEYVEVQDYADRARNEELWKTVHKRTKTSQLSMKDTYDRKSTRSGIEEGDWIMLGNKRRKNALCPLFEGPGQ